MTRVEAINSRLTEIVDTLNAIEKVASEANGLTDADNTQIDSLNAEFAKLNEEKDRLEKIQAAKDTISAQRITPPSPPAQAVLEPVSTISNATGMIVPQTPHFAQPSAMVAPAALRGQKSQFFDNVYDAYEGAMFLAAMCGSKQGKEFMNAQSVGADDKGGYSVPKPLSNALVNLLVEYGVARRKARTVVMSAMTWDVPKVVGHATVMYPAEAGPITESDVTFAQINLVAKKIAALVKMSTEIIEDSIISMIDTVIQSIAYSMAQAEDDNLFNGVAGGVNTEGIKGNANVAGVNVAGVASIALEDLTAMTVAIGEPVIGAVNEWYINPTVYHGQIRDIVNAAGGNTIQILEGGQRPMLLGYPVNFVNVLAGSTASTSGDLLAVFGDLGIGCYFGDRRQLTFKILRELYAETDQVGVIATERIDPVVANPEVLSKLTIT